MSPRPPTARRGARPGRTGDRPSSRANRRTASALSRTTWWSGFFTSSPSRRMSGLDFGVQLGRLRVAADRLAVAAQHVGVGGEDDVGAAHLAHDPAPDLLGVAVHAPRHLRCGTAGQRLQAVDPGRAGLALAELHPGRRRAPVRGGPSGGLRGGRRDALGLDARERLEPRDDDVAVERVELHREAAPPGLLGGDERASPSRRTGRAPPRPGASCTRWRGAPARPASRSGGPSTAGLTFLTDQTSGTLGGPEEAVGGAFPPAVEAPLVGAHEVLAREDRVLLDPDDRLAEVEARRPRRAGG